MGNSFAKGLNSVFGQSGQGGVAAGGSPEDWPGSGGMGGGPAGTDNRDPDNMGPTPQTTAPPVIPQYQAPPFFSPRQSQLQKTTYNPSSTSHQYLQRYGAASHY